MKSNLGKLIIISLLFAASILAADVKATLDKSEIFKGDSVNFTISAQGSDVKFPDIKKIGGFEVLGTSNSQSTTIVNGKMSQSYSKSYTFAPRTTTKIPPFSVEVDGKVYKTDPLVLKVVKPSQAKAGAPYILEMKLDKHDIKVGESVRLDLKFKQKRGTKADKIELSPPDLKNFWVKEIKGVKQSIEGDYIVQTYSYMLFAQKPGDFTIPSVVANIGTKVRRRNSIGGFSDPFFDDPFFNSFISSLEWKKIFSNEEKLHVEALPDNLEVYGDFNIEVKADKREVSAGKPVNITITITGEGNVDDIEKFEMDIPQAVVYADEPKIQSGLHDGKYVGKFTQKIAVIADSDFVVPSLEFSYFDSKTRKKRTKRTSPIKIKVKASAASAIEPKIETSKTLQEEIKRSDRQKSEISNPVETENQNGYLYLFVGALLGSLFTYLVLRYEPSKKRIEKPVVDRIKRAKDDKELYDILLAFANKGEYIKAILKKLEENIYKNKKNSIDKDEIADYFEQFGLE